MAAALQQRFARHSAGRVSRDRPAGPSRPAASFHQGCSRRTELRSRARFLQRPGILFLWARAGRECPCHRICRLCSHHCIEHATGRPGSLPYPRRYRCGLLGRKRVPQLFLPRHDGHVRHPGKPWSYRRRPEQSAGQPCQRAALQLDGRRSAARPALLCAGALTQRGTHFQCSSFHDTFSSVCTAAAAVCRGYHSDPPRF